MNAREIAGKLSGEEKATLRHWENCSAMEDTYPLRVLRNYELTEAAPIGGSMRFRLTPLGLEVRAILLQEQEK